MHYLVGLSIEERPLENPSRDHATLNSGVHALAYAYLCV
jgi:hypothetical protein